MSVCYIRMSDKKNKTILYSIQRYESLYYITWLTNGLLLVNYSGINCFAKGGNARKVVSHPGQSDLRIGDVDYNDVAQSVICYRIRS